MSHPRIPTLALALVLLFGAHRASAQTASDEPGDTEDDETEAPTASAPPVAPRRPDPAWVIAEHECEARNLILSALAIPVNPARSELDWLVDLHTAGVCGPFGMVMNFCTAGPVCAATRSTPR